MSAVSQFQRLASVHEVPDPGRECFELGDRVVVLFHVDGQFYCLDDVCTHDGGPLGEGILHAHSVACARHGAQFDIRTGAALTMPATKPTACHEVKVENGEVWVREREAGEAMALPANSRPGETGSETPTAVALASTAITPSGPSGGFPETSPTSGEAPAADGPLSEDRVRESLTGVIDPELFVNIVDLGLIYNVELVPADAAMDVKIDMTMTSPMCPAGPQLIANSKMVVGRLAGVGKVEVKIVLDPPWTPDRMTEAARDQLGIF